MHTGLEQFNFVKNKVSDIINKKHLNTNPIIIVVTKTFPLEKVAPLLDSGHMQLSGALRGTETGSVAIGVSGSSVLIGNSDKLTWKALIKDSIEYNKIITSGYNILEDKTIFKKLNILIFTSL